ncbi:MAG: DMT family transporter, partial [Gemmatimonadales bacterium]
MSPRLQVVLAAVLFSTAGAAIKLTGFSGWQVAAFRALIALVTLLILIPEARSSWSWRAGVVGVAYAGAGILFVLANKLTTAASALFLTETNPLYLLILAPWLLGERTTRGDLAYMGILGVGMALFFLGADPPSRTAPDPLLGNILAAGVALCWAFTLVGYRWLVKQGGDGGGRGAVASAAIAGNLIVFLVALPVALPLQRGGPADWLPVIHLGVFQLGLAYVFLSRAVTQVRALEIALVLLVEPVLSATWAWLVHGETPGPAAVAGGAVILTAGEVQGYLQGLPDR